MIMPGKRFRTTLIENKEIKQDALIYFPDGTSKRVDIKDLIYKGKEIRAIYDTGWVKA
jgi:hypothetical protein